MNSRILKASPGDRNTGLCYGHISGNSGVYFLWFLSFCLLKFTLVLIEAAESQKKLSHTKRSRSEPSFPSHGTDEIYMPALSQSSQYNQVGGSNSISCVKIFFKMEFRSNLYHHCVCESAKDSDGVFMPRSPGRPATPAYCAMFYSSGFGESHRFPNKPHTEAYS